MMPKKFLAVTEVPQCGPFANYTRGVTAPQT